MHLIHLVLDVVNVIHKELHFMSAELDRLTAEVGETSSAVDSVLALVAGLAEQIRLLSNDPGALLALADSLDAQQAKIAEAVTANTPPAEPPVEPVEPEPDPA